MLPTRDEMSFIEGQSLRLLFGEDITRIKYPFKRELRYFIAQKVNTFGLDIVVDFFCLFGEPTETESFFIETDLETGKKIKRFCSSGQFWDVQVRILRKLAVRDDDLEAFIETLNGLFEKENGGTIY